MLQAREKSQKRNSEANLLQLGAAKRLTESPSKLEKSPTQQRRRSIQMNSPLPSSKQKRSWRKSHHYLFYKFLVIFFFSWYKQIYIVLDISGKCEDIVSFFIFIIKSYLFNKILNCSSYHVYNIKNVFKDSNIADFVDLYKKKTKSFLMELQSLDIIFLPSYR